MRSRIFIGVFVCSLLISASTAVVCAQATLEGKIIDTKTGEPLSGVNVFLSGTKTGTATNSSGRYQLRHIPPGGYRLIVSIIGYERIATQIVVDQEENRTIDFELKPVVYKMPEIYVGDLDKKWKKNLEWFTDLFIGESKWADSVKILNPEILRFDTNFWGRLTSEALAPLKIENRALGYRITYYLEEFRHNGTRTRWDGEPLFSEMKPTDSIQADYWKQNRREAFYGSLRHFLLALLNDSVKEEGFKVYKHRRSMRGFSFDNRFPASASQLISKTDESFLYHMNFFGRLEIIYTRDKEDWDYVNWLQDSDRGPGRAQTSYLELNEHPITVDADGEIIQPYGATQFGYFAFERLADATPREYRPEGYPTLQQAGN